MRTLLVPRFQLLGLHDAVSRYRGSVIMRARHSVEHLRDRRRLRACGGLNLSDIQSAD